jgi:predicted TIM-barrel fold metal-dependent hydrolase
MSIDVTTSTPTKRRQAPPPIRNLRLPNLKLPPGACDTHFHFLGPQREFPFNPNRHFVPDVDHDDSTIADWKQMQSALGLSRGLLVQSMMYYPSYELALHGLCLMPDRLRGVVSLRAEITDRELDILTKAGVVGVRFTDRPARSLTTAWSGAPMSSAWACITCSMARSKCGLGATKSWLRRASS